MTVPRLEQRSLMPKRLLSFNLLIWTAATACIAWLLLWPLVLNAWASYSWNKTPCFFTSDGLGYIYHIGGEAYASNRQDFWQLDYKTSRPPKNGPEMPENGVCWVDPSDPANAVRFLNAHKNWANSTSRFGAAGMLLCVTGILTWSDARRRRAALKEKPL